ncbi:MAG: class I SAM-dependent methyltransferase [Deltaproteobacteria bacterium]|nr:class I SAM-dependent methyltransferase [Deltaproteobacteria bacterium]
MVEQVHTASVQNRRVCCPICCNNSWTNILELHGVRPKWWESASPDYTYRYISCDYCGFVQLDNTFSCDVYEDYYATCWLKDVYSRQHLSYKYTEAKKFIAQYADAYPKEMVMEVGADHCDHLNLYQNCKRLVAIDPSPSAKTYVKKYYPDIEFHLMSVEEAVETLDALKSKADLLICSHVLEHIERPDVFLAQLDNFVAPGGYLYLEVPSLEDPGQRVPTSHLSFIHINHFSEHSLALLAIRMGYQPIKVMSDNMNNEWSVIRGLFKKDSPSQNFKACFLQYATKYTHAPQRAVQIIQEAVRNAKKVVIWGASVDLWDILHRLSVDELEYIILVDSFPDKQGASAKGIAIVSPEIIKDLDPDKHCFFTATRSHSIHISINDAFSRLLPSSSLLPLLLEEN